MTDFKTIIAKVADAKSLTREEAKGAFETMMSGAATPAQTGAFLMALRVRGETVEEITGAAEIMRARALPIDAPEDAIDTCGTGGDAKGTYNISTAAAFVVAGSGVPVAKHGNKSISSKSGSADVLASLGVRLDVTPQTVATCIQQAGLGFMFAPAHHSAMKHVAPARAELGTRTIFNLLGPLANPAKTRRQVIGVYAADWVVPLAEVLQNLGARHVWVVHGSDGLDELTTTGPSHVAELKDGAIRSFQITPDDADLPTADENDLKGGDANENAEAIRRLLQGEASPFRDIVALNAAAALIVAGKTDTLKDGVRLALEAINSGKAKSSLDRLVALTNI